MPDSDTEFKEAMAEYEADWEEAITGQNTGGGAQVLDAGTYQAKIDEIRIGQTGFDSGWELYIKWIDLESGRPVSAWDSLESEIGRSIAASHMKALGFEGTLGGLKKVVETGQFNDLVCEIRVKDRRVEDKVYKSIYVNRLYGKLEEEAAVRAGGGTLPEDEVPFR